VIFYHGQKAWPYDNLLEELMGSAPAVLDEESANTLRALRRYQPSFEYVLINLHDYDDDKIMGTFNEGMLRASLLAMRDYALGEPVRRIPRYISNLQGVALSDLSLSFVSDLAKYIMALGPEPEKMDIMREIKEETIKIHPSDQPGFVSALDAWNREKEEAAREAAKIAAKEAAQQASYREKLAIARNLKSTEISISAISVATGLPIEVIEKL